MQNIILYCRIIKMKISEAWIITNLPKDLLKFKIYSCAAYVDYIKVD